MELTQIAEASAAVEDGEWVESNILPGVSFLTRGLDSDPCRRAFQKHIKRLKWQKKKKALPHELDLLNARVLLDGATLGWRGIHDKGEELSYSKERFAELLFEDKEHRQLRTDLKLFLKAAYEAAASVGEAQLEIEEEDEKNLENSLSGAGPTAESARSGSKTAKS